MKPKKFVKEQVIDYISTLIIVLIGTLVIYFLYNNFDTGFIIYGFVFIVIMLVLYHSLFVVIFLPLMFKSSPLENEELTTKIKALATKEGFKIENIVVINASEKTTKINAYFSGFGKSKKVMLFDTLFEHFNDEQLLSIIAHEIGHSKYRHMLKDLITDIFVSFVYFALFYLILSVDMVASTSNPFIYGLVYMLVIYEFGNKLLKAVKNSISRKHEKQADMFVVESGFGVELIYSLTMASKKNMGNLFPHPLFVTFKFDHPPYYERVNYLKGQE